MSGSAKGFLLGCLGVLGFSMTLPATRVAVEDLDATFVGLGRAVVAGALAAGLLLITRAPRPPREALGRLAVVALGVVVGFPLFTTLALRALPAAHSAVIVGLLPMATALAAVMRAGERPSRPFWAASGAGLLAVLAFAAVEGAGAPKPADGLVLLAVASAALGYAEGGVLARQAGGGWVISWALVLSLPFVLLTVVLTGSAQELHAGAVAWTGFAYVSLVSMFLAFFAWYQGLALGGVAKIGQLQLAQPVLTLVWSAWLLGEKISAATAAAAVGVLLTVGLTQRTRAPRRPPVPLAPEAVVENDAPRRP